MTLIDTDYCHTSMDIVSREPISVLTNYECGKEGKLSLEYRKHSDAIVIKVKPVDDHALPFYRKLMRVTDSHLRKSQSLTCYFQCSVVNCATVKLLFNYFKALDRAALAGKEINVVWSICSLDDDLFKIGMEFNAMFNLDLRIERGMRDVQENEDVPRTKNTVVS